MNMDMHPLLTLDQKRSIIEEMKITISQTPSKTTETTPTSTSKSPFEELLFGFPLNVLGLFEDSMDIQKYIIVIVNIKKNILGT